MYNNFGNPYNNFYANGFRAYEQQLNQPNTNMQPVQPIQQSSQQVQNNNQPIIRSGLQGKIVDSIDVAKVSDIPMDFSTSYFPVADGSAIVSKQLQQDGTSKIIIFKPSASQNSEKRYITQEELKKALDSLNSNELDNIKEDIKEIKKQIKKKSD